MPPVHAAPWTLGTSPRAGSAGSAGTTHYIHDLSGNVIAETAGGGATGASGTVREVIWLPEAEISPTFSLGAGDSPSLIPASAGRPPARSMGSRTSREESVSSLFY